jgi:RNA polymerase sigma-70 factor (ECF subfamily)
MGRHDADTTNPALLIRLGDWRDHEAWVDFIVRYDPVIRSCCRQIRLDAEATDELCQRVWIDLARRMRTFRYDPRKTFRGWLFRLCRSRAIDLLRRQKAEAVAPLDEDRAETRSQDIAEDGDGYREPGHSRLLRRAREVQDAVRRRVDERTWRVFWDIAIEGRSVRETAEAAGLSYAAAFAARKRVSGMLREEGRRLLIDRRSPGPDVEGPETD